jgi:hypothetical protein
MAQWSMQSGPLLTTTRSAGGSLAAHEPCNGPKSGSRSIAWSMMSLVYTSVCQQRLLRLRFETEVHYCCTCWMLLLWRSMDAVIIHCSSFQCMFGMFGICSHGSEAGCF